MLALLLSVIQLSAVLTLMVPVYGSQFVFADIVVLFPSCNVLSALTDEVYLALVTSTKAHARIINVDTSDAFKVPGFVTYVDHKDVPGQNATGPIHKDEEVFATNMVSSFLFYYNNNIFRT